MIGYPYGQFPAPTRIPTDGFGYPCGRCRLIAATALPFGPRLFRPIWRPRVVPRLRLRLNFGEPGFGALAPPVAQQMVYDGLGNPIGAFPFLPAIAALAAKVLPVAAQALPMITKALPAVTSLLPGLIPPSPPGFPAPPTIPSPTVSVVAPGPAPLPPLPPPCPPPTMEECRRLFPLPPPPMPLPPAPIRRRRRPRIVRLRQR
jgi:hypothetical protein